MSYCSSGHANPDATGFCASCGQQLLSPQPAPPVFAAPLSPVLASPANPWGVPQTWSNPAVPGTGRKHPAFAQVPAPSKSNGRWTLAGIAAGVIILLLGVFILTRTGPDEGSDPTSRRASQDIDPLDKDVPAGGSRSYVSDGEQIQALLEGQGVYLSATPTSLDDVAQSICVALEKGNSQTLIASMAMATGLSRHEATSLVAVSTVVKCPWES